MKSTKLHISQQNIYKESETLFDKGNCYGPSYCNTLSPLELSLWIHIHIVHPLPQGPEGYK